VIVRLAALLALTLLVPFGIRALDTRYGPRDLSPSYLPALEGPRARTPFDRFPFDRLVHYRPELVVIGDSMAGTRIDPAVLEQLSGRRVFAILHPGSGSAFWYLALKNWVIASGVRPRAVFIFFRDANLTDLMFRMDTTITDRVALDREPDLNDAIASRAGEWRLQATRRTEALYRADRARLWMVPRLGDVVAAAIAGRDHASINGLLTSMNERFEFDHMRPIEAADIDTNDTRADFDRDVHGSVLPLMLRDARNAGISLYFVRVQRRPVAGRPPHQSPALRAYVAKLADYVRAHGGLWRDDTGDPALSLEMYGDGDHLAREARERYTSLFWNRVGPHLQ
jgi:hypothetical protein